eukprot:Nk52_evm19s2241 gene=Nk52_evmTU19s2241
MAEVALSLLLKVCMHSSTFAGKFPDGPEMARRYHEIKEMYQFNKKDLKAYEGTAPVAGYLEAFRAAMAQTESFYEHLKKVNYFINKKYGKAAREKVREAMSTFNQVMSSLTKLIAESSQSAAKNASGSVSKLAIASGHPDWEVLNDEDAVALCVQGDKYLFGYGLAKSYDTAFKRYMAAAKFGLPAACNMVGTMFENGLGREIDLPSAVYWYKEAAENDLGDALNNLGRLHENGKGVEKCVKTAEDYYRKAAENGHADAQANLGYLYEKGLIGLEPNYELANDWYKQSAYQGYAKGMNHYGSMYYHGLGCQRNPTAAVEWYRKGASQGHAPSQNNLGICYEEGAGVPKDLAMAKEMYHLSASQEYPSGLNNLGYMYLMERDYQEADRLFRIAAAKDCIDAEFNLGLMTESGHAVGSGKCDMKNAVKFYTSAANRGYTKAQVKMGILHYKNAGKKGSGWVCNGVAASYAEATQWFRDAALKEDPEAMYRLGVANEEGHGDGGLEEAIKWYKGCLRLKYGPGIYRLGRLYEVGLLHSSKKAANKSESFSSLTSDLSVNVEGRNTAEYSEKHMDKAIQLYNRASNNGSLKAKLRLVELKNDQALVR